MDLHPGSDAIDIALCANKLHIDVVVAVPLVEPESVRYRCWVIKPCGVAGIDIQKTVVIQVTYGKGLYGIGVKWVGCFAEGAISIVIEQEVGVPGDHQVQPSVVIKIFKETLHAIDIFRIEGGQ